MATYGKTRYDRYLTDLALAYPVGNMIGEVVAPIKSVDNYSDKVFVDADDAINQVNDEAEETASNGVDFGVGDPYSYRTTRKALNSVISDKEANNAEKIVKAEKRETIKLTHRLKLKHEKRTADVLTDPTKVTQTTALTGTARWDSTAPDLEASIITAVNAIYANTGSMANTIVIPFQAALYAANMTFIKDTLQYQYGMEVITSQFQQQVMKLVGLPPYIKGLKVVISSGRINNSNKGQTKSVEAAWGKDCLIGYVPVSTNVEDQFGILTMEYDSLKVSKEKVKDPNGTKILVEWDYDLLEAELKNWYLLQDVIS
jgi:hypothetical protein